MEKGCLSLAAAWAMTLAFCVPLPVAAQEVLGTAQSFAVLGGAAVTNTGGTTLSGDLGVGPGTAITGFPPGLVAGVQHPADAVALQAQADTTTAYNVFAGAAFDSNLTGTDLGGLTLPPGVYRFASSAQLTGTITLDAQGDPSAVFIFQIGSTLISASSAAVSLINGAQACNVFWKVGSSATLGTGTAFAGNILALTSITLNNGVSLSGRALARVGAVSMDNNAIAKPACAASPPAAILVSETFAPNPTPPGGVATLAITYTNTSDTDASLTSPFVDTLPSGVVVAGTPNTSTTCGGSGTLTGTAGGTSVGMGTGYIIPAGSSCSFVVDVTAPVGTYENVIDEGSVVTSGGNNSFSATATLRVGILAVDSTPTPVPINTGWLLALMATVLGAMGMLGLRARSRRV